MATARNTRNAARQAAGLPGDVRLMNTTALLMALIGALLLAGVLGVWAARQPVFSLHAIRVEGDVGTIGITQYAQEQLGDVVFVDEGGAVLEGPRSAVVLAVSGADGNPVLVTPDATAILPSTTQRALFAAASARGVECVYRPVNVTDLLAAQGVWLLSAITLNQF